MSGSEASLFNHPKRILLHICCAPCAGNVYQWLVEEGWEVEGYFFNPNIHPYQEYERVLSTLKLYAAMSGLNVYYDDQYLLQDFLQGTVGKLRESQCTFCYQLRLGRAAGFAKRYGFQIFSTTLLASPHDEHEWVKREGYQVAEEQGLTFLESDFRKHWQQSVRLTREMNLYQQKYCGCIFSEQAKFR